MRRRVPCSRSRSNGRRRRIARAQAASSSVRCSKCRALPRCSTSCCRASISFRSAPTTSPNSCSPPTVPIRGSRSATTGSARRSCAFSSECSTQARAAGVPARVCGEMAGRPLEAMALIGIGAENFSITPAGVGPVKAMVRSLDAAAIRARLDQLLAKPPRDMRKALTDWARRHSVTIG